MTYKIVFSRQAEKAFYLMGPRDSRAMTQVIDSLEEEPWPVKSASVVGTEYLRIRVRGYRIIYEVGSKQKIVYIKRIARRNEKTYKNL